MFAQARDVIIQNASTPLWRDLLVLATPLVALVAMWRTNVKAAERQQEAFQEERSRWAEQLEEQRKATTERLQFDRDQGLLAERVATAAAFLDALDSLEDAIADWCSEDPTERVKAIRAWADGFRAGVSALMRIHVLFPGALVNTILKRRNEVESPPDVDIVAEPLTEEAARRIAKAISDEGFDARILFRNYFTTGALPPATPATTSPAT